MLKIENLEAKMVLGATGILCLFAPLGATGPRFSSSESFRVVLSLNLILHSLHL